MWQNLLRKKFNVSFKGVGRITGDENLLQNTFIVVEG